MKGMIEEIDNQEEECAILENSKIDDTIKIKNQRIMESKNRIKEILRREINEILGSPRIIVKS